MGKPLDTPQVTFPTAASRRVGSRCAADEAKSPPASDALTVLARALARQSAREAFCTADAKHVAEDATQRPEPHAAR